METIRTASGGPVAGYFVYMLRCAGGSLYTGITTDVGRRVGEHLSGASPGARYTRTHRPEALVALWRTEGRASASRLEYRIKRLSSAGKRALLTEPGRANELCRVGVGPEGTGPEAAESSAAERPEAGRSDVAPYEPVGETERERLWQTGVALARKADEADGAGRG